MASLLARAARRRDGMSPIYYVDRVIDLVESGGLDESNERLMERVRHLASLIISNPVIPTRSS